jgi:DNA adenine methylase
MNKFEGKGFPCLGRTMAKPFLKWVGGKTQILESVLSLFPQQIQNYHEPFVGGGSVLLGLLSDIRAGRRQLQGTMYASDSNPNLIALYKHIQTNPTGLLEQLHQLNSSFKAIQVFKGTQTPTTLEEANTSQESYYYWIRKQYNEEKTSLSLRASAMMLFLNKTCFRGVYRENKSHEFNVPFGNYKILPTIYEENHIRAISQLIQHVVFSCQGFEVSLQRIQSGDFVYLDPPYAPETETSFVGYTGDGFSLDQHKKLFELCKGFKAKHIQMVMSNANVPLVTTTFQPPDYEVNLVPARRAIHSKDPSATTDEVLLTNF